MTLLEVSGLTKHFPIVSGFFRKVIGQVRALEDVSFTIERGSVLGVVGESGSGKSTLARLTTRLLEPTKGAVFFDGTDIFKLSPVKLKKIRKRFQIVFQNPAQSLNQRKTVSDTLKEALLFHEIASGAALYDRIEFLLKRVGLSHHMASRYPHELSLGQQQRVAIARAMSVEPEFLVLDECVSALDVSVQAQILNLLLDLQKEFGMTYLFISHDLHVVAHLADDLIVMDQGRVVEQGTVEKIYNDPQDPYTKRLLSAALSGDPHSRCVKLFR